MVGPSSPSGSAHVGVRQGGRGGGAAGSPPSASGGAQTFWAIRVRSVWSVRWSVRVSRGGGGVQRGQACRWAMHGLQNQCSIWALLQPRSCPRSGASSSPTISRAPYHIRFSELGKVLTKLALEHSRMVLCSPDWGAHGGNEY